MKILAFAGSTRPASFNRRILNIAIEGAISAGADVSVFDFGKKPMPLYDPELEQAEGLPANAKAFKTALLEHQGLLIASPEYNSAYSPLLKNAIDWASRSESTDEPALAAFKDKTAAILAASPGKLGGLRGLTVLRMLLTNIGVTVLPTQIAVPGAHELLDADNQANVECQQDLLQLGMSLATVTGQLNR